MKHFFYFLFLFLPCITYAQDSLVLHLSFNNGELTDQSDYKNTVNAISITPGKDRNGINNNAAVFDGDNSKIFIPNFPEFEPPATFAFYIKKEGIIDETPGLTDLEGIFFKQSNTGIGVPYSMTIRNTDAPHTISMRSDPNNQVQQLKADDAISAEKWHFLVAHFEEEKLRIFSDYTLLGELDLDGKIVNNAEDLIIGAIGDNFGGFYSQRHFKGLLDEFKIFNKIIPIEKFAQDTLADSLIFHLSFDNKDLTDQSVYKNNVNPESITFGRGVGGTPNNAAFFDGENSKIFVPDFPKFEPPLTFSLWMNKTGIIEDTPGLTDLEGIFFKKSDTGVGAPYTLTIRNSEAPYTFTMRSDPNNQIQQLKAENIIFPDKWYSIVAHFENQKLRLYVDFELQGELDLTGQIVDNTEDLIIGAIGNNFGGFYSERYFNGFMDDFKIFNKIIPIEDFKDISSANSITPENNIIIYPNPVNNILKISGIEFEHIEIFNIQGAKVMSGKLGNEINVSSLKSGMFILRGKQHSTGFMKMLKFVKN